MASFLCCPFSPLDFLDEIWDLIESVSEGFLTYSYDSALLIMFIILNVTIFLFLIYSAITKT